MFLRVLQNYWKSHLFFGNFLATSFFIICIYKCRSDEVSCKCYKQKSDFINAATTVYYSSFGVLRIQTMDTVLIYSTLGVPDYHSE